MAASRNSRPCVVQEADRPLERWEAIGRGAVVWRTLFSGDRTATDSLTVGVAEVRQDGSAPPRLHRHAQAEVYYVLSGAGRLRIEDEEHALVPGVAAFIPGGALHGAWATGPEPLRLLYAFAADAFSEVMYEFPESA